MNKIIAVVVKIAGLVITAPVTWRVAGTVFSDIEPESLRLLIQMAALLVVEGVFLTSWLALEQDKSAPSEVKVRHAVTALIMYGGLWMLALQHGESWAGIVFRLALGAALVGSIFDSGIYTIIQQNTRADRDINHDGKVKRIARDLAKNDRILELKLSSDLAQTELRLRHDVEKTVIEKQIIMDRNHRMTELKVLDSQFTERSAHTVGTLNNGNPRLPAHVARQRRKAKADERQDLIAGLLRDEPGLSQKELAKRLKDLTQISGMTARTDVQKFYEAVLTPLSHNGNGHNSD